MSRWRWAGALVAIALLTGCPSRNEPAPPEPKPSASIAPSGSPAGGAIRFGILGEPATLDPYSPLASDGTWTIDRAVYPSLFRLMPDGSTEPWLVDGVERSAGNTRLTLHETGWSDGQPITAEDVIASYRRARARPGPSGFHQIAGLRAVDERTLTFRGSDVEPFARLAFVLPRGRADAFGGPFRIARRTAGLEVVMEPNPGWTLGEVSPRVVRVQYVQSVETMLALLEEGRLDAASVPSTVNLTERLNAASLHFDSALGWESLRLSFGEGMSRPERAGFLELLDLGAMRDILIRDDGRRSTTLHPSPGDAEGPYRSEEGARPSGEISLTAPVGDELLELLQRAMYAQLDDAGVVVEAAPIDPFVFYGRWLIDDPSDVSIRRVAGARGLETPPDDPDEMAHAPLFQVATYVVWREGLEGPAVNPAIDGPLWNLQEWEAAPGA
jgi:Bacterial extracellular solute-binding proteins, family 5 Middle